MSASASSESKEVNADAAAKSGWLAARPWAAVIFLMMIGILNYLDRVLPSILAEPIKHDLGLSDTFLGLINGIGFLLVYAIASIPIASLSDRGRYNFVITFSLGVWSLMTMVGGWVTNGVQLALSRSGVALGEAGGMPAAHAFITRHIPSEDRTRALAIFTMCLPLGTMAGFVVGGFVGQQLGWRPTFVLMGGVGLALAAVSYFALGQADGGSSRVLQRKQTPARFSTFLQKRSLIATLCGGAFVGMGGYVAMAFTPAFLMRSHGMSVSEAGVTFGFAGGACGVVGLLLMGWVADKLAARDLRWLLGVVIVMIIGAMPLSIMAYTIGSTPVAMVGLAINLAIAMVYAAPVIAALHRLAPLELRARASALLLLSTAILGGLGPVVAGAVSDALQPRLGEAALGRGMLVVPAAYFLAALCFAAALPTFRREVAAEIEEKV